MCVWTSVDSFLFILSSNSVSLALTALLLSALSPGSPRPEAMWRTMCPVWGALGSHSVNGMYPRYTSKAHSVIGYIYRDKSGDFPVGMRSDLVLSTLSIFDQTYWWHLRIALSATFHREPSSIRSSISRVQLFHQHVFTVKNLTISPDSL